MRRHLVGWVLPAQKINSVGDQQPSPPGRFLSVFRATYVPFNQKRKGAEMKDNTWKSGRELADATGFERYLTVEEVAAILRRSPRTIRGWISTGCPTPRGPVRLEAVKLGRAWMVRPDWLAVFEHRVRPPVGRTARDIRGDE